MVSATDWQSLYTRWFGASIGDDHAWIQQRLPYWFAADPAADAVMRTEYAPWITQLTPEVRRAWQQTPRGSLTLILLFDQVPRNAARGTPAAFAHDAEGLRLAEAFAAAGLPAELDAIEAFWAALPFQHQEDLANQDRSVEGVYAAAARARPGHGTFFGIAKDMADRHRVAIERFGRFPHRNVILGRTSTPEELTFLEDPRNHF